MPTKEEILDSRSLDELKNMARDKDISGYTTMRKSELIDAIDENCTMEEIRAWGAKQEMLDAKGLNELREMAMEKDIPRDLLSDKADLIDAVRAKYTLDEVIEWDEPDMVSILTLVVALVSIAVAVALLIPILS